MGVSPGVGPLQPLDRDTISGVGDLDCLMAWTGRQWRDGRKLYCAAYVLQLFFKTIVSLGLHVGSHVDEELTRSGYFVEVLSARATLALSAFFSRELRASST